MKTKQVELTDAELQKMHSVQLQILRELDRVCRDNNIKYIIEGGSLLGAVRHKGFIPWDDDIDVRMLRSEYEKFCKVSGQLSSNMTFQNYNNDKGYPWLYSKIRMNGTKAVRIGQERLKMHGGIFIDIFPCDGIPDNEKTRKRHNKIAKFCRKVLYARTARYTSETLLGRIAWSLACIIPKKLIYSVTEKMAAEYTESNCSKVGIIGWHGIEDANGFPLKYFTELTELEFEGYRFYAPKDYDSYLRYTFGDHYMEVPPVEKRIKNHGIVDFDLGKYQ